MGKGRATQHDSPAPAQRPTDTRSAIRASLALLLAALLVPALLLALASWRNREDVLREADIRVERTLRVLQEHAVKVFETQKLILDRVNGRLRYVNWDSEAERAEFHGFLADLQREYDQVVTITVTDPEGRMQSSSRRYPADPAVTYADRDWFQAVQATESRSVYVSRSYPGRQSGQAVFNLALRAVGKDGGFGGAVVISADRGYFEAFYREVDPDLPHSVVLIRGDGQILAREPRTEMRALAVDSPMYRAMLRGEGPYRTISAVDGVARIVAYRKVAHYPVYIGFGVDESAVLARWWQNVVRFAVVAGLTSLALLGVSALALRQTWQEQRATQRWRVAADALAAEAAERQRAEAQLRQAQKMEAVGRLTGGVAHDFNNLLTVVIGNLEMARRRAEEADPRVVRGIDNAMEGARRATTLTHRLLAFSRQSPLAPEAVDPNRLVHGMSDLFRHTLGETIAIETAPAAGLWWTMADANQMESAILNLAVNARDAMPGGGTLTIETGNVFLDASYCSGHAELRPGQYAMIAVRDTGTGMTPEVLAQAVEPFFTTKPAGKGSGLGLAQVYGFMRQSGGHFAIQSEAGRGTTVKLYFPRLARASEPAHPLGRPEIETPSLIPDVLARAPRPDLAVLAVEDDPMVRAFSVAALEEAGYRVHQAATGAEALEVLAAHPGIDLLFTDVVLGGSLDGRGLAETALSRKPGLKVLFTTGYTRNAIIHHGRLDEGVNFLGKPFTAASLGRKVRATLAQP